MPFDPNNPVNGILVDADFLRSQFNSLKTLIDAVPAGPQGPAGAPGTSGPLLLIQHKIGTVQALSTGMVRAPVEFTTATFAPLGSGGTFDGGTFTASATGVFRFSYRLIFDALTNPGPGSVRCSAAGTVPGVGDVLFAGMVNGAVLTTGFGFGVISFSETIGMASGETYRLTALQNSGWQVDITGGEAVIERLG